MICKIIGCDWIADKTRAVYIDSMLTKAPLICRRCGGDFCVQNNRPERLLCVLMIVAIGFWVVSLILKIIIFFH